MDKFFGIYQGKVLGTDVLDIKLPVKTGKIKVEVYPMLIGVDTAKTLTGIDGVETEQLPWAVPAPFLFSGSGDGFGSFVVPNVGTYVYLFFLNGDIYQPVYFAEAINGIMGLPAERLVDYPNTKVWKSKGGVVVTINDKDGNEDIKILHPTGTYIQIDKSGIISIEAVGSVNINGSTVNINS